jgi:membrane-anchored glycerophosphoryl diester phosphodiesterase (GDPDase)
MILDIENHNREHKENRLENKLKRTKYSCFCTPSTLIVIYFAKKNSFTIQLVIFNS